MPHSRPCNYMMIFFLFLCCRSAILIDLEKLQSPVFVSLLPDKNSSGCCLNPQPKCALELASNEIALKSQASKMLSLSKALKSIEFTPVIHTGWTYDPTRLSDGMQVMCLSAESSEEHHVGAYVCLDVVILLTNIFQAVLLINGHFQEDVNRYFKWKEKKSVLAK